MNGCLNRAAIFFLLMVVEFWKGPTVSHGFNVRILFEVLRQCYITFSPFHINHGTRAAPVTS